MGITGVPCFLLESRYAVMGAQETDALADAIRQVAPPRRAGNWQRQHDFRRVAMDGWMSPLLKLYIPN